MSAALQSLIESGTKLWLDSIDPDLVAKNRLLGATGATSNPIIISNLLQTGRFDDQINRLVTDGLTDEAIAWELTDKLVSDAQKEFLSVWEQTKGNDGYVSFELDPLLEDAEHKLSQKDRIARYVEAGIAYAKGHSNRMIKVPATPAGLGALEELAAAGVTLNVTLIFTAEQYRQARDAVWKGAQRRESLEHFKSVYSIFVSRIDVFTEQHVSALSPTVQGQVGIVNAKRIWQENHNFWLDKAVSLNQEIIFASTGTKKPEDAAWKYVKALAGSDIQTNPPTTNQLIAESSETFSRQVDVLPAANVLQEIDELVDFGRMQDVLMQEGVSKFVSPQKSLLALIATKRTAVESVR